MLTGKFKKFLTFIIILISLVVIGIISINLYILKQGNSIFTQIADVPTRNVALVMGTDLLRFNGSTNSHFLNRTEGAAKIYFSGKSKNLLISGNKNNKGFNEVGGMEVELLKKGIPKEVLALDFDGNSTWQSIQHAKEVYHLNKIIVVTDSFHAPRVLFLCHHFGIDAVAYCYGKDSFGFWFMRYHVREWFARVKAFFEVVTDRRNA